MGLSSNPMAGQDTTLEMALACTLCPGAAGNAKDKVSALP
jgi:hypothetical protein